MAIEDDMKNLNEMLKNTPQERLALMLAENHAKVSERFQQALEHTGRTHVDAEDFYTFVQITDLFKDGFATISKSIGCREFMLSGLFAALLALLDDEKTETAAMDGLIKKCNTLININEEGDQDGNHD